MAKENHLKMALDGGTMHAAKFGIESLPGVKDILDALTDDEKAIVVNLVRMDNLAYSFEALAQFEPRLFPAYEQVFEVMENIAMDMMHAAMRAGSISKDRYFELCEVSDKITALAKEHANTQVLASESPVH